ncbi:hypothetical protein QBC47DRAFT_169473 [Echria macrotheca]|uniref:Uncharacterized protein n=1 Tax=Echria macrotheca TaxID=438768 RepID=A0AAJ0BF86_9PEZI|nr:hypothetical protein QBC47DRAFT_169473 [Echria macrotheca]
MMFKSILALGVILLLNSTNVTANPIYNANPAPDTNSTSTLNARTDNTFCGLFSTASRYDAQLLLAQLHSDGGDCSAPAKTCSRVACWATSAIYVCNDNDHAISPNCVTDVVPYGLDISQQCCGLSGGSVSGQRFHDTAGFNVIVAYGNCNHDRNADRPALGPWPVVWGPNGACR